MSIELSNYRKFVGLTQTQMAEVLGVSLQSYWKKENGKTPFSDKEKIKVKKLLLPYFPEIKIDDIFFNQKVSKVENEKREVI